MRLHLPLDIYPNVFHRITHAAKRQDGTPVTMRYYCIVREPQAMGTFVFVEDYSPATPVNCLFSIGTLSLDAVESSGGTPVGYLLYPRGRVTNNGSSLFAVSGKGSSDGAKLILKTDLFNVYSNPFVSAAINGVLHESFESSLTQSL